jgi:hypothetical protein
LHALIEALPSKASAILDHMKDLVHRFIDKGLLAFTYVHILLWEYIRELTCLPAKSLKGMAELITAVADNILPLLTTKPGSKSACIIISYSSPKERKRIIKAMKGHVMELAMHHASHLALMRLVEVTDDTVNIQKSLFEEIRSTKAIEKYSATGELLSKPYPPMVVLAMDRYGSKFVQHLLHASSEHHHLMPDETSLFINDPNITTSKKSFETRRMENLVYLKPSMINQFTRYAADLLRSRSGSQVLESVFKVFYSDRLIDTTARVFCDLPMEDMEEMDDQVAAVEEEEEDEMGMEEDADAYEEDDGNQELNATSRVDYWANDENENLDAAAAVDDEAIEEASNHLPIHEDPVAHLTLKSILQFEASLFSSIASSIDQSLFDTAPTIDKSFSMSFLRHLSNDRERLATWLSCNRSCLALADIWKVNCDEIHHQMVAIIDVTAMKSLKTHVDKIQGAKILSDILSSKVAPREDLVNPAKAKKARGK